MKISIVIPTYNEAENIGKLVHYLKMHSTPDAAEIIIADGESTDDTVSIARKAGATALIAEQKGRAPQMNFGASAASGDVLYFMHADCFPPATFVHDILTAVKKGYDLGRYQTRFDTRKMILHLNAWFTRFDLFVCMGGDQTLFIRRPLFESLGGFRADMKIMEEYEFCQRARKQGRYKILDGKALISDRKYNTNSWLQVQKANAKIISMYKKGASQQEMLDTYKQMLSYRKNAF
jgi:rSAM/selenodomain-associated transferase 2